MKQRELQRNKAKNKAKFLSSAPGFALLYTVIVISLILTIAISISNVTYKQSILSSLAKDSQIAFYQADSGIECGMLWDAKQGLFPLGTTPGTAPATLSCGAETLSLVSSESSNDYLVYDFDNGTSPCYIITFDKTALGPAESGKVQSRGHNVCDAGPRQVERALEVVY